ncbi:hypothetical protein H6G76_08915 [Nostoc sp. FACHB-152]|uniref:hypothetical protein n=1 Tax=unclassified Nostoc TaxID=2593658 RepID=UPI00168318C7|nr:MULTISPECIES: hypothetical protein [unclassified Nostoc]MBD2447285.1 hypothetical protein [Nostoc sp. FACHB-152]MBD2468114.1 hypothetical protein [Nostoc sp. FACHB-145]
MIYRLALTSSLILANAITFSQAAIAESVDVSFSAVVPDHASISTAIFESSTAQISSSFNNSKSNLNTVIPAQIVIESSTNTNINITQSQLIEESNLVVDSHTSDTSTTLHPGSNSLELEKLVEKTPASGTYTTKSITITLSPQ